MTVDKTYPIRDLRQNISRIADQLSGDPDAGAITVTKRGKPVLAVMSWDPFVGQSAGAASAHSVTNLSSVSHQIRYWWMIDGIR